MKVPRTRDDLITQLREQILFIKNSVMLFDEGIEAEAKRMATSIRNLVHDNPKSGNRSLLNQLDNDCMLFYDTAIDYDPRDLMPYAGLVMYRLNSTQVEFQAPLDDGSPNRYIKGLVPFDDWWNKPVLKDKEGKFFSRRDIVLSVRDTDGGGHIDPTLEVAYADLTRNGSLGWSFGIDGSAEPITINPLLPSLRQISHEVLKSMEDEFPELF